MPSIREAVEIYIRAKDENRPYLMERAFAENATLEMVVNSGTISFPPISIGLESISNVLVRRFAQTYENVHTFCLASRRGIMSSISHAIGWLECPRRKLAELC